jgi:hypothetical protein
LPFGNFLQHGIRHRTDERANRRCW